MSAERRFFLAHAKSDGDDRIAALLVIAKGLVERFARGQPFAITTGRDFYAQTFKGCGSWPAWAAEVAAGVDFATRAPRFHAILVPATRVGAGTAGIIERAIEIGKPVFAFLDNGRSARVVRVVCEDPKDWQHGYKLTVATQFM